MATSVETVARSVVAAIDTDAGYLLSSQWVAERYQQLLSRARFKSQRKIGEVLVPATYKTGTVTVTQGSNAVVGVGTGWLQVQVGKYLRAQTGWYEIASVTDPTHLTLTNIYTETSGSGKSYALVSRRVSLLTSVRWLGEFLLTRTGLPLQKRSTVELDLLAPTRPMTAASPTVWTETGLAADGLTRAVEFYPYPLQDELLTYIYYGEPPTLTLADSIPDGIDPYILKEGALIDLFRYEMGKAMRMGSTESAALWRNEYRAQQTAWEKNIQEAIRTDSGSDDIEFLLTLGPSSSGQGSMGLSGRLGLV